MAWHWRFLKRANEQKGVLIVVTLAALVALLTGSHPLWGALLWLAVVVTALALAPRAEVDKVPQAEVEAPSEKSCLPQVSAAAAALDMPVIVLDREGAALFQNAAATRALGVFPVGVHVFARLRSPGVVDMVRETLATSEPNQIEHSERLPSERVYVVRIAPVTVAEKAVASEEQLYLLSFRDISELRRIDRMRSDFVANASHELRTPLASLRGFIETLLGPAREDPKARERFLVIMLDQVTRMSRLVDDLLSLSRLEVKSHLAPDQNIDLVPLLGHVRDALAPLAEDLDVAINLHLPEGKAEVLGDRDELVQVFENLIENACKYGQEGKAVDVYLRNGEGRPIEVSVVDRGAGIPAEHVPRLTERFYRVSVEDSRSKKGTGLGLAIVKHILTRHRARLIVHSKVGEGTEFTVRF
ncbi:phosphate regulon sensor histidine kinase PhoR [Rhizobiaceae bacterium n13]|uniref:histidine kinase n=1 Tax=Ferirhizobium litorale TaxID=2927786 RepID=A0AAE3U3Z0_9HYPH|nr:phosphate regulon sensor histidine kinase PhoR [Fererhizobium litorale]MDI7862257.1 phosphate regulon sensor histidine kinase PhoR [Fererhizobium litorale]MDI7922469.1 phosphate regulon sensor histidine kinase PhoR [Fererhizobium litorale]